MPASNRFAWVALAAVAGACDSSPSDLENRVARVGDAIISAEELRASGLTDPSQRRRLLDQAIARILAAEEATRRQLPRNAEVAARLARLRRDAQAREQETLRDSLFVSVRDGLTPTESDLRRHFEATKLRYAERQVRLRWWGFTTGRESRAALAEKGGTAALAPGKSESIGPTPLGSLPAKVLPEVFHFAKPGDRLASGTESEGFGVVELVEVLPAAMLPFEAVRDRVEASWRTLEGQRAFAKLMAELREKAHIEIDEAALANDALWQPEKPAASESIR
jgi:hypothetical protein